jgi:phage tail-like protein
MIFRLSKLTLTVAPATAAILALSARPAGGAGAGSTQTRPDDALTAGRFSITVDGVEVASFSELVRITSEVEPSEPAAADVDLPGKRIPPAVVLKRGMDTNLTIFAWHQSVVEGQIADTTKNATLVIYDSDGRAVAKYYLESAWPAKVETGAAQGKAGSQVLWETVTFVCDHIQRVSP